MNKKQKTNPDQSTRISCDGLAATEVKYIEKAIIDMDASRSRRKVLDS